MSSVEIIELASAMVHISIVYHRSKKQVKLVDPKEETRDQVKAIKYVKTISWNKMASN